MNLILHLSKPATLTAFHHQYKYKNSFKLPQIKSSSSSAAPGVDLNTLQSAVDKVCSFFSQRFQIVI